MTEAKESLEIVVDEGDIPEPVTGAQYLDACKRGDLAYVTQADDEATERLRSAGFDRAYRANKPGVAAFLISAGGMLQLRFDEACANGWIDMAKVILPHLGQYSELIAKIGFTTACQNGHGNIAEWLVNEHGAAKFADDGFFAACEGNSRGVAVYMMGLGALDKIAVVPPSAIGRKKMDDAIRLARANNWCDIADQFTARYNIINAPVTMRISDTTQSYDARVARITQLAKIMREIADEIAAITRDMPPSS